MAFPIEPDQRFNESEKLFLIQDPFGLRKSITPVFIGNRTTGEMTGYGTSFFINPFGRQISAMHVVTDFFNSHGTNIPPNSAQTFEFGDELLEVLFDPGLILGCRRAGSILHASDFMMFPVDNTKDPLAITMSLTQLRNLEPCLDLIAWNLSDFSQRESVHLPIKVGMGRPWAKVGDRVMAVGYSTNGGSRKPGRETTTYEERMVGSIGAIIECNNTWDHSKKIWPSITVDCHWPPGMSGGPVFNEDGIVIGIVSRGGETWSRALWLQALPYHSQIFNGIDPHNPGWVTGWGVCNSDSLIKLFKTHEAANRYAAELSGELFVRHVSTPYKSP